MIKVKRYEPSVGERLRVHMNLHENKLSVRSLETENYNKTLLWTDEEILLRDVDFRVSEKVAQKIRNEGVRQVCAYVVGYLDQPIGTPTRPDDGLEIGYNPFKSDYFYMEKNGNIIESTDYLMFWMQNNKDKMVIPYGK